MEELRKALGYLYEEVGHNETTVKLSQYLDNLIVKEQKKKLEELKRGGYYEDEGRSVKAI